MTEKEAPQPQPPVTALAPLPAEFEEEEKLAAFAAEQNLARMALLDPDKVEKSLKALALVMKQMREIAISDTVGIDWTLFKDREGKEVAVLRDSGAVKVRKWLGISIFNHRHDDGTDKRGPRVWIEDVDEGDGRRKKVQIVSGIADGFCSRTGEHVAGIPFAVRNEPQEFTGRKHPKTKLSNLTDLLSSWRTGIDAKVVRVLGGVRKIPKTELARLGVDVATAYLGHGYGSGAEREAAGAAEGGIDARRLALRNSIVRRTGGDMDSGKKLVREITSRPPNPKKKGDKGFPGVDSLERLTLGWQIDNAFRKLKAHPVFGNKSLGWPDDVETVAEEEDAEAPAPSPNDEREPGEDG